MHIWIGSGWRDRRGCGWMCKRIWMVDREVDDLQMDRL